MIKVGLSAKIPDFIGTARRLAVHPDVEIVWIYNNGNTARISTLFPELTGEMTGSFAAEPDFDEIDLYIGPWDTRADGVKAIYTGDVPADATDIVPGIPELYRKNFVRGARAAVLPDSLTLAGALALMPAARNLLLGTVVAGAAILPGTDIRRRIAATGLITELPALTARAIAPLQASFSGRFRLLSFTGSDDTAMFTAVLDTPMGVADIAGLYHDFYDDHRHTVILENPLVPVCAAMVRGTNKGVIAIAPCDGGVSVTAAIDAAVRCGSGMTVHLTNLMFGLDELTGF